MITCKDLAAEVKATIKREIEELGERPRLSIISVGDDPASASYIRGKVKDCQEVGIDAVQTKLPANCTQQDLNDAVIRSNEKSSGVIVQLPLPDHLNANEAVRWIDHRKDVDGLKHNAIYTPCTARGVYEWLAHNITLSGKHVVIINRSRLVGRPLAKLLLDADATVTICHSKSNNLSQLIWVADVVIVAVGKPNFIHCSDVKRNTIIVDVGINKVGDKLCGDCAEDVAKNLHKVTPVPGGVGLLTRAYLLRNVLDAHKATMPSKTI